MQSWKHQDDALKFALEKVHAMLAMDMGAGKSRVAIKYCDARSAHVILVVCPLSVVPSWVKQFEIHGEGKFNTFPLDDGSVSDRAGKISSFKNLPGNKVFIVNYDAARLMPLSGEIEKIEWDVIILDESHRIKSPGGKTSWFAKRMRSRAKARLCLTGTPLPHSALDAYAQYRFLNPDVFQPTYQQFKMQYAVMGGFKNHQVVGFKNMEDFNERFYRIAFRVRKQDVLDLPETVHVEYPVSLSEREMSAYTSLENEFIAQLDEGIVTASNALAKLLRLQQITSGFVGGVVGESDGRKIVQLGNSKRSALREIFEDISPDQPIVVFCRFINDLESIHSVSAEVGRSSLELSGSKKELEDWQAGKANVLAVQIQSGGVGIDLTRSCYAIYYSTGFSLSDYEQSLARLHRPGQKSNVTYIHLVAKKTVDEKVARALSKRASVVESVLKQYSNAELTGGESRPVE